MINYEIAKVTFASRDHFQDVTRGVGYSVQ